MKRGLLYVARSHGFGCLLTFEKRLSAYRWRRFLSAASASDASVLQSARLVDGHSPASVRRCSVILMSRTVENAAARS